MTRQELIGFLKDWKVIMAALATIPTMGAAIIWGLSFAFPTHAQFSEYVKYAENVYMSKERHLADKQMQDAERWRYRVVQIDGDIARLESKSKLSSEERRWLNNMKTEKAILLERLTR